MGCKRRSRSTQRATMVIVVFTMVASFLGSQTPAKVFSYGLYRIPIDNPYVTHPFGAVFNGKVHDGIDYRAQTPVPVLAAASGTVVEAKFTYQNNTGSVANCSTLAGNEQFGNRVMIDHGNGQKTIYAHLSYDNTQPVRALQAVTQGQVIGLTGFTGCASAAHLHFQVQNISPNYPVNPAPAGVAASSGTYLWASSPATAPGMPNCTPGTGKVALYINTSLNGRCVQLGVGSYSEPYNFRLPNDSISSVSVGPGASVKLCQHTFGNGTCNTLTASDSGLADNTVGNDSVSSIYVSATGTSGSPPTAPSNVFLTKPSSTSITVNWTDTSTNDAGFQIDWWKSSTKQTGVGIASSIPTFTGGRYRTFTNLATGYTYCFQVRSWGSGGNSAWVPSSSIAVCTTIGTTGSPPAAPSEIRVLNAGPGIVNLYYRDNASNETSYQVTDSQATWSYGASTGSGSKWVVQIKGLPAKTYKCFQIRAINGSGSSSWQPSTWVCLTTQ